MGCESDGGRFGFAGWCGQFEAIEAELRSGVKSTYSGRTRGKDVKK